MILLILQRFFYVFYMIAIFFIFGVNFSGCAKVSSASNSTLSSHLDSKNDKTFVITKAESGVELDFDEFIKEISSYDIIIIGEQHDSLPQHILQGKIITALNAKRHINVVYEMISTDKQPILNLAKKNKNIAKDKLKDALEWDKKWDYEMYKYPIEATFYSNAGLYGGNLSREEINMFFSNDIAPINGKLSTTQSVKDRLKDLIETAHTERKSSNASSDSTSSDSGKKLQMLDTLVEIQQYKDRRMADVAVHTSGAEFARAWSMESGVNKDSVDTKDSSDSKDFITSNDSFDSKNIESNLADSNPSAVLIAGQYHAFKTLGVPLHIQDFNENKKIVVVLLTTKGYKIAKKEYDYLITFNTK